MYLGDSGGKSSGKIALKLCRNGINGNKYRISLYSYRGNYYFLNLEIVANLNSCRIISIFYLINWILLRKLFKGGNYSRAETIWGNTAGNPNSSVTLECQLNSSISLNNTLKYIFLFTYTFSIKLKKYLQ